MPPNFGRSGRRWRPILCYNIITLLLYDYILFYTILYLGLTGAVDQRGLLDCSTGPAPARLILRLRARDVRRNYDPLLFCQSPFAILPRDRRLPRCPWRCVTLARGATGRALGPPRKRPAAPRSAPTGDALDARGPPARIASRSTGEA